HHGAVGELGDLVLVHLGAHRGAHGPRLAVVVGVDGVCGDVLLAALAPEPARVLLDQAAPVLPVAQLDARAGGGEHGAAVLRLDHLGEGAVLPGLARVMADAEVRALDAAVRVIVAVLAVPHAGVLREHAEQEEGAGLGVDHVRGIGVAALLAGLLGLEARSHHRRLLPGAPTVAGAALPDRVRGGGVAVHGALVEGGQQIAVRGDREGGDAEVRHPPVAGSGEHLLLVAALAAAVVLDRGQGGGRARGRDGTGAGGGEGGGGAEQAAAGQGRFHRGSLLHRGFPSGLAPWRSRCEGWGAGAAVRGGTRW